MKMSLKTRACGILAAVALTTGAFSGVGSVVTAAPAEAAASCTVTNLGWWSVKNSTCSSARHFNHMTNKTRTYAGWVGKGKTSSQLSCWSTAVGYGFGFQI